MGNRQQQECDRFNERIPVGTEVEYWRGIREGEGRRGKTRSEAQVLSGHTAVVWIEGCSGCVALSHVKPSTPATQEPSDAQ